MKTLLLLFEHDCFYDIKTHHKTNLIPVPKKPKWESKRLLYTGQALKS